MCLYANLLLRSCSETDGGEYANHCRICMHCITVSLINIPHSFSLQVSVGCSVFLSSLMRTVLRNLGYANTLHPLANFLLFLPTFYWFLYPLSAVIYFLMFGNLHRFPTSYNCAKKFSLVYFNKRMEHLTSFLLTKVQVNATSSGHIVCSIFSVSKSQYSTKLLAFSKQGKQVVGSISSVFFLYNTYG